MSSTRISGRALALAFGLAFVLLVAVSCRSRDETAESVATTPTPVESTATEAPVTPSTETESTETTEPSTETEATAPLVVDGAEVSAPETPNELAPGDHVVAVRHGDRNRSYIVHVPESVPDNASVVMALHGGGGTGEQFQQQNGLDAVADREGFIAIYPEGSGLLPNRLHTWNSGDSCCGFAMDREVDDVGFLRAVIEDLGRRISVDPERLYITGHSNGGMMAYRMAAEASDVVTAIVPVGGAMDLAASAPSEPVAVLHIHSVDDPRALYGGGEGPPFPGTDRTVNHEPVMTGIEKWVDVNGCDADPTVEQLAEGTGSNVGHTADLLVWQGCADGAPVEHLRLSGSGHGWPGVTVPRAWQELLGPSTTLIDASEEVWAFANR